jgi:hypothetical protein
MIKQIILSSIIIIYLSNCNNKKTVANESTKMVVYRYDSHSQDFIDTIVVNIDRIDSSNYSYKFKSPNSDKWSFELKLRIDDSVLVIPEGNLKTEEVMFICVDRKMVRLYYNGDKYYTIYKILRLPHAIDSQGLIFWSPEFGIILERSLTWKTFIRFEYLKDETKNNIIRHLNYSIMHDNVFYNLPDWEEKYKLK